jgi:hypothetical protein
MWPALVLFGVGRRRRLILPGPLFLLWPLIAAAWLVLGLWWLIRLVPWCRGAERPDPLAQCRIALILFGKLSGLLVELAARDGARVYIRFV